MGMGTQNTPVVGTPSARAPDLPDPRRSPPGPPHVGRLTVPSVVRLAEQTYIAARREAVFKGAASAELDACPPLGLALSGGGIRSATFAMGVLQRLAEARVLPVFDYMSTVSGGGYIGSCLSSNLSRKGKEATGPSTPREEGGPPEERSSTVISTDVDSPKHDAGDKCPLNHRDQVHLRARGDYLIAYKMLLNRDVLRVVGTLVSGTLATLVLYALSVVVLLGVAFLYWSFIGGDAIVAKLTARTGDWNEVWNAIRQVFASLPVHWRAGFYAFGWGAASAVMGAIYFCCCFEPSSAVRPRTRARGRRPSRSVSRASDAVIVWSADG
jgi:hypothetical protein